MSAIVRILAANSEINPVAELQKSFALIKLGGKVSVVELPPPDVSWGVHGTPQMFAKNDGSTLLTRALQLVPSFKPPKDVIADFFASPSTAMFDDIAFDPRPTGPSVINLWTGPTVMGGPGTFPIIQQFIDEIIANGDPLVTTYLFNFMAHMLQRPEEKPRVMLVLMGGQGTGKGTFCRLLQSIWSRTTLVTNQIADVTGNFNSVLERKFVIWLDEALFAGDYKATDALKSLITEPTISLHAKYQEPRNIFSCHRFFAATNASHFARTDVDDRRFVYLPVSDRHKGNRAYWDALNGALASPELPALVDHLQNRNLVSFDPTRRPSSTALVGQKIKSLTGFDRWWYSVLQTGEMGANRYVLLCEEDTLELSPTSENFISTSVLVNCYQDFAKAHGLTGKSIDSRGLKDRLDVLCPLAQYHRAEKTGKQKRGYRIPSLPVARSEFETFIGGALEWPL
jgi:hypothetical protein